MSGRTSGGYGDLWQGGGVLSGFPPHVALAYSAMEDGVY